jgi:8-oxo-dGTP diphosphatase
MIKGLDYPGISVTYACHDGAGNFVMHKRSNNCRDEHGLWDFGGGGIGLHEHIEDALKREVMEEYCANILEYEFLGYRDVHRQQNGQPTHWVALDFKVLVDKEQVRNGEPDKLDDLKWFTLDKLPKKLHSQIIAHLKKYKNKLQS